MDCLETCVFRGSFETKVKDWRPVPGLNHQFQVGTGVHALEINRLRKQFEQLQKMMKQMQKGGMAKMMRAMKGMMPGMR